jgi:hypothetical protein
MIQPLHRSIEARFVIQISLHSTVLKLFTLRSTTDPAPERMPEKKHMGFILQASA